MRQNIGDPGSISTQNLFPLISVIPKPSESPLWALLDLFLHTQVAFFYETMRVVQFPDLSLLWGSFFKMDFRRRTFNQKPLAFRKNPRTHLEVQGSFGDEGTFQECQKDSTIRWDRKLETRGLFRRRICFRSFLSHQNPLSRHMVPDILFWPKIKFSPN